MRPPVIAALAALALFVAACGDDDADDAATTTSETTTSSTTTSTTTTSTSTTTTTAAPTTTSSSTCSDSPLPGDAADTTTAPADLDGDGTDDTVTSYRVGPADAPEWHLHAQLTSGGGADLTLPAPTGPSDQRVLGGSDANENGTDEVWVKVGAGASAQIVSMFVLDDCDLVQVTLDGGGPAEFPVGGSIGTVGGVYCADEEGDGTRDVVVASATQATGSDYEAKVEVHHLVGTDLQFAFGDAGGVDAESSDFARFTQLDCDDAQL
ncbi:MAG: hypothetical protein U5K30_05635 [Acidimicrobiales bacterium]|nr:hypothetical protein [Acidimicrobiales bacterium]